MKLKGQVIRVNKKEYILKQQLGEGGFSMIYQTKNPEIICKVQVLSNPAITNAYNKEKQMLNFLNHPHIVKLYDSVELSVKEEKFGFLFMENCGSGTAFSILEKSQGVELNEKIIIKILVVVAQVLEHMHKKGVTHRDIKMQNVLINSKGQYKICDFGSCSRNVINKIDASNRVQIEEYIEKTTTPLYRSPQQLDLYSGYEIGSKVDIFALGVLAFIMCFQKPPFQSRLSAINKQYFIPEDHSYSPEIVTFIEKCFATNPNFRPNASQVRRQLQQILKTKKLQVNLSFQRQFDQASNDLSRVNEINLKKNTAIAQTGFFDKIKRILNQITTQTQGWIAGFIEDNQQAPLLKYNRSIISKCYEKRYKIEKVYDLIWKYSQEYKNKSLVTLKLLILLHNLLRKGPSESITYDKENSPVNLCVKIYKYWKVNQKTVDEQDIKRNAFVNLMIKCYSLVLIGKLKLCYQNSHLIEANYSIVPYLTNIKHTTILKLTFISSMINFLNKIIVFHQQLFRIDYLHQIQKSIILSLIDEQYCLISTLTFILSTFKMAVCYSKQQIDIKTLQEKIKELQNQFQTAYKKLIVLFQKSNKSNMLQNSHISLNMDVINYIKSIKLVRKNGDFCITDHLNYKNSICGLKIPLTYEEVVKNPTFLKDLEKIQTSSKNIIELNQFKVKKQAQKQVKNDPFKNIEFTENQPPKKIQSTKSLKIQEPAKQSPKFTDTGHNSTSFSKQKDGKDKIFENFSFTADKKQQQKANDSKKSNMMEFTHQNLNKDFMSIDNVEQHRQNGDHFKDFFSIVEQKFQKEKETKKSPGNDELNNLSGASKQVYATQNKTEINKIQLMNFFFDDDEEQQPKNQKVTTSPIVENKNQNTQNLIDLGPQKSVQVNQKNLPSPQTNKNQFDLISLEDQPKQQKKVVENTNEKSKPSSKDNNLIDLKEFIVEQVKRNAQQYIIQFSNLVFKEKIGYGNSSQVFKGQWRGREVAIKKIKDNMNSARSQKQFKRQIMTSVRIRHHPQLVTLIGVSEHDKYFYIINEYCNGSTLFDLLHQSEDRLPWPCRISIAKQIAKGMLFLHTNDPPIIHRDLKSLNVLLISKYDPSNSDTTCIKIADFGLSRDYASTYMTGTLGTYHWMAPQIFNNEPYTLKADVYSYGIVLWEIASRVPPYTNMKNPHSLMKYITVQNGRPDMSFVDKDCPQQLKTLMMRCWDKFPSNRPNFSQILNSLQSQFK